MSARCRSCASAPAIKEPMDIAFLFWSISAGIVTGAGLLPLAVLGSLFIGIFLVLFVNKKSTDNPYILVVSCAGTRPRRRSTAMSTGR